MRGRLRIAMIVLSTFLCGWLPEAKGGAGEQDNSSQSVGVYHRDPDHLWNRLFLTFYCRQVPTYHRGGDRSKIELHSMGPDVLDTPFALNPRSLLADAQFNHANVLLDEFLNQRASALIEDPVKKVMLQRDLWAVFDTLSRTASTNSTDSAPQPPLTPLQQGRCLTLQRKIANIIRSLALSRGQIEKLPDTYAAAVNSRVFSDAPNQYNFLPHDLFATNSPWVEVQPGNRVLFHTAAVGGRSVFRTFVKSPPGFTNVVADYLRTCNQWLEDYQRWAQLPSARRATAKRPPERPARAFVPVGTQLLLLREMLCLDENLQIRPTHMVESIEFRTTRKRLISESLIAVEFELDRTLLFQGKQGGLRPIVPGESRLAAFDIEQSVAPPFVTFPKNCSACHPPRRLETVTQGSANALRSAPIDQINRWKEKRGDLKALREFISLPATDSKQ